LSAKPTALAAFVVVVVGVVAGVAIGGKTETRTRTVTVTASADTSTGAVPPAPPTSTAPEPTPGFQAVVLGEENVTIDDTTRSTPGDQDGVTLVDIKYGVPAQLQQGPEKNDALTFDFDSSSYPQYAADYYQFEITVPDNATKLVSEMGFLKGEATGNSVKVAFYRNQYDDSQPLKQLELDSASETASVDLVVRGASKIIVRLTCTNKGRSWKIPSGDTPSFGFVDAHFE
jgi:hypothetical protein